MVSEYWWVCFSLLTFGPVLWHPGLLINTGYCIWKIIATLNDVVSLQTGLLFLQQMVILGLAQIDPMWGWEDLKLGSVSWSVSVLCLLLGNTPSGVLTERVSSSWGTLNSSTLRDCQNYPLIFSLLSVTFCLDFRSLAPCGLGIGKCLKGNSCRESLAYFSMVLFCPGSHPSTLRWNPCSPVIVSPAPQKL